MNYLHDIPAPCLWLVIPTLRVTHKLWFSDQVDHYPTECLGDNCGSWPADNPLLFEVKTTRTAAYLWWSVWKVPSPISEREKETYAAPERKTSEVFAFVIKETAKTNIPAAITIVTNRPIIVDKLFNTITGASSTSVVSQAIKARLALFSRGLKKNTCSSVVIIRFLRFATPQKR